MHSDLVLSAMRYELRSFVELAERLHDQLGSASTGELEERGMISAVDMHVGHYYMGYSTGTRLAHWNGEVFIEAVWDGTEWRFNELLHPEFSSQDVFVPALDITKLLENAIGNR